MFAAWSRMRKLEEATNGKDEPAPVYLLDEIFQEAQQGIQEVGPIVEFCLKRLTARPAIVKQKTLRLIKHLCNKGANEFRRAMARHSSAVKEMTHYKGEPDPLKGDVPNQRVRDAAREALDALFGADSGYASTAAPAPQLTNRIQGFGSTNYSAGGSSNSFGGGAGTGSGSGSGGHTSRLGAGAAEGIIGSGLALGQAAYNMAAEAANSVTTGAKSSGAGSGSGMQGFGNPRYETGAGRAPNYAPPATGSGGSGSFSNTGYGGRSSPAAGSTSQRWGSSVAGAAGNAISGASNAISGALSPTHRGRGSESMLGDQAGDGYNSDDHGQSGHRQAAALTSTATHRSNAPGVSAAGSARDVVDRLCAAGGVRAQPGAEELRTFVDTIGELDGLEVGSLLAEKMEGTSWQAALRALCAVEAIVQQGLSAACGEAAVFFQSDPRALHAAAQSPQATVRARARRVLTAIGAETLPDAPSHNRAPAAAPSAAAAEAEPDLLGGLGDDGPAAASPQTEHNQNDWQDAGAHQQQQQPAAAAAPDEDLLDLMGGEEDVTQPQLQPPLQQQQQQQQQQLHLGQPQEGVPPQQAAPVQHLSSGLNPQPRSHPGSETEGKPLDRAPHCLALPTSAAASMNPAASTLSLSAVVATVSPAVPAATSNPAASAAALQPSAPAVAPNPQASAATPHPTAPAFMASAATADAGALPPGVFTPPQQAALRPLAASARAEAPPLHVHHTPRPQQHQTTHTHHSQGRQQQQQQQNSQLCGNSSSRPSNGGLGVGGPVAATASSNGGGGPPGTQNPNSGSGTPNPDNPKIPPLALTVEQLQVLLRQHAAFAGLERDNVHLQELLQEGASREAVARGREAAAVDREAAAAARERACAEALQTAWEELRAARSELAERGDAAAALAGLGQESQPAPKRRLRTR
eukprot:CAMPEP_0206138492 /NCGR_PEP_ID=MMETSP1473-20131121/3366_1 /ASSEMBLY_ACC=CAM_ASM_001109 /TAXON_ID=1461547 /ORGANISM="Stichococcus sp, Strain RCC1054" /LENGTH=918 /DNA_ID=CAMNT_0053531945 /DNA_START=84 /DNA_END=2840 /DNA_ORIENTATION=-